MSQANLKPIASLLVVGACILGGYFLRENLDAADQRIRYTAEYAAQVDNVPYLVHTTGIFASTLVIELPGSSLVDQEYFEDWLLNSPNCDAANFRTELLEDNGFAYLQVGSIVRAVAPLHFREQEKEALGWV